MSSTEETTTTSPTHGHSVGAGIAGAVKGVAHAIHGIGEVIRGNALDFADNLDGKKHGEHSTAEGKLPEGDAADTVKRTGNPLVREQEVGTTDPHAQEGYGTAMPLGLGPTAAVGGTRVL